MTEQIKIDPGNNEVKVYTEKHGAVKFNSAICEWFKRTIVENHDSMDKEVFYDGVKVLMGKVAELENTMGSSHLLGVSKNHIDAKLRILAAVHQYTTGTEINLVTGSPFVSMYEKDEIKESLEGKHTVIVDGRTRTFTIKKCIVCSEGAGAFFASDLRGGLVHVFDIGSGTINITTHQDRKIVNSKSFTLEFGMLNAETGKKNDSNSVAMAILRNVSGKVQKHATILVCGGATTEMVPALRKHFKNAEQLNPRANDAIGIQSLQPIYANVIGFHNIGVKIFANQTKTTNA